MKRKLEVLALFVAFIVAACSDTSRVTAAGTRATTAAASTERGANAERYVAIGTSISMGWASNGVYDASQRTAWPALLAFADGGAMSLPLIQSPGCTSPIVPPLAAGTRLSGEPITGSTVCAPNDAGVVLPTQNVGLAAALAADVLLTTPEAAPYPWFARVLPSGVTALQAALGQQPTIISVELGGNEVLGALSGLALPGVTIVPLPYFTGPYDAILNAIGSTHPKAVLVGLPTNATNLPALRRGDEIWADRAEFAALHVDVSSDCDGSPNYINVSIKSLTMVFTAAFTSSHGLPDPVFSCADVAGTQDLVLTPTDIALVNGFLAQMNDHVRRQAAASGYGFFSLGALYDLPGLKGGPYSVITQLTSQEPYGPYVSLDGVHPNRQGHLVLASAAARAINTTYGGGAHVIQNTDASVFSARTVQPPLPSAVLAQARKFALAHQGERLSPCAMIGGCDIARRRNMR